MLFPLTFWFRVRLYHVLFCSFWVVKFHVANAALVRKGGVFLEDVLHQTLAK
jgi:hypothetical protein